MTYLDLDLPESLSIRSVTSADYRMMSMIRKASFVQKKHGFSPDVTWSDIKESSLKKADLFWAIAAKSFTNHYILSCPSYQTNLPVVNEQGQQFCAFAGIDTLHDEALHISSLYSVMPSIPGPTRHFGKMLMQMMVSMAEMTQRPAIELLADSKQSRKWYLAQGFDYKYDRKQVKDGDRNTMILKQDHYSKVLENMEDISGIRFRTMARLQDYLQAGGLMANDPQANAEDYFLPPSPPKAKNP